MNTSKSIRISILLLFICSYGWAQRYKQITNGVKATVNRIDITIQFYSPELVRVLKAPSNIPFEKKSLSVIKTPETTILKITQSENTLNIGSKTTSVRLDLKTGNIKFYKHDATLL